MVTPVTSHLKRNSATVATAAIREKRFKCDFCQKSYTSKQNLSIHVRTHAGENPYKCEICQKSFPVESSMKTHMKTHIEMNKEEKSEEAPGFLNQEDQAEVIVEIELEEEQVPVMVNKELEDLRKSEDDEEFYALEEINVEREEVMKSKEEHSLEIDKSKGHFLRDKFFFRNKIVKKNCKKMITKL